MAQRLAKPKSDRGRLEADVNLWGRNPLPWPMRSRRSNANAVLLRFKVTSGRIVFAEGWEGVLEALLFWWPSREGRVGASFVPA